MKHTNKNNFPDFVVEWLKHDDYDYDANTMSATTLMQPPRAYALSRQNWEDLEIDVSDVIASRYGTAIHDSVEKVKLTNCKQEQRLRKGIMNKTVTGKFDILKKVGNDSWELIDVKSTSVWSYIYGSKDEEYIKQLSIYRWLAIENGYNVIPEAKIWMIFTDWSQERARKSEEYPNTRIAIKPISLWNEDQTMKYIGERITLLDAAVKMKQEDMPKCTDEELWAQADVWQIMKEGRKTAVKNCETEDQANEYIGAMDPKAREKISINLRKGGVKRCKYCIARKFCTQYQDLVIQGRIDEQDTE